ncbi:hypothetical protein HDU98_009375, partial [Podochytrium sp. JEL0797]
MQNEADRPAAPAHLDILSSLPPPPTLPQTPLQTVTALVLMPFCQGMFYGLGEGVARLLVFEWWGIENFTTIPTAGVTSSTAGKLADRGGESSKGIWSRVWGSGGAAGEKQAVGLMV